MWGGVWGGMRDGMRGMWGEMRGGMRDGMLGGTRWSNVASDVCGHLVGADRGHHHINSLSLPILDLNGPADGKRQGGGCVRRWGKRLWHR